MFEVTTLILQKRGDGEARNDRDHIPNFKIKYQIEGSDTWLNYNNGQYITSRNKGKSDQWVHYDFVPFMAKAVMFYSDLGKTVGRFDFIIRRPVSTHITDF